MFVYKLITAGSIEEKSVAMQVKKAALADASLSEGDGARAVKFMAEDLAALFELIPEVTVKMHESHWGGVLQGSCRLQLYPRVSMTTCSN